MINWAISFHWVSQSIHIHQVVTGTGTGTETGTRQAPQHKQHRLRGNTASWWFCGASECLLLEDHSLHKNINSLEDEEDHLL